MSDALPKSSLPYPPEAELTNEGRQMCLFYPFARAPAYIVKGVVCGPLRIVGASRTRGAKGHIEMNETGDSNSWQTVRATEKKRASFFQ